LTKKEQNKSDVSKDFLSLNKLEIVFFGHKYCKFLSDSSFLPGDRSFMASKLEKRLHSRQEALKPIRVLPIVPSKMGNIYEIQDRPVSGETIDISETGAGLKISTRSLQPQSLLKLIFESEEGDDFEVYAKIIWSERSRCGVRFVLSDQAVLKAVQAISTGRSGEDKESKSN
jgi:hypothetical protein